MNDRSAATRVAGLALVLSFVLGCAGVIGEGADSPSGAPGETAVTGSGAAGAMPPGATAARAPGSCTKKDAEAFGPSPLRRLTKREYTNTIQDLFGAEVATAAGRAILIEEPPSGAPFDVLSQALGPKQVEDYFLAAETVSNLLVEKPARLTALAPCLAQAPITDACARAFIEQVGRRLYRRPLGPDEVAASLAVYQQGLPFGATDGVRFVLFAMLQSVHFLYRPELAGTAIAGASGIYQLSPFELATRLSYMLWGSTPDDKLLDASGKGALESDVGLLGEVDRLLADPRARAWAQHFFEEWLELDGLPSLGQGSAFFAGISKTNLVSDMRKEITRFALLQAFGGTFKDLMASPVSFITSPDLARVYGVEAVPGDGRTVLPDRQRAGLVTRAAMLASSGSETSPVHRGVLVMRNLLCEPIPSPDPNSFPPNAIQPPAFDAGKTGRTRWTEKTGAPACAACHGRINAFGYALEGYDPIGRHRDKEIIYTPGSEKVANQLPIDSAVDLTWPDGKTARIADGVELAAALATAGASCFGRQWFRFGYGRLETREDGCFIEELGGLSSSEGGIKAMWRRAAVAPANRARKVVP